MAAKQANGVKEREVWYKVTCTVYRPVEGDEETHRPKVEFQGLPSPRDLAYLHHHTIKALRAYRGAMATREGAAETMKEE
jgi:hypothetical protein